MTARTFHPKTVNWEPPNELPQNWRIVRRSEDGAAYKSRTGISVIISCCVERESLALQVLPPRSEWVNDHPFCLHLYQCLDHRPTPDFRKLGTI